MLVGLLGFPESAEPIRPPTLESPITLPTEYDELKFETPKLPIKPPTEYPTPVTLTDEIKCWRELN